VPYFDWQPLNSNDAKQVYLQVTAWIGCGVSC
jgi:hypothetical protein